MSNEIKLNFNLNVANGFYNETWNESDTYNQSGIGAHSGVQTVTTSFSDLSYGSVTTPGYLVLKNLDTTNNVEWGIDVTSSFVYVGLLQPGEIAVLRVAPSGVQIAMKAVTTTLSVQYLLLQT